MSSSTATLEAGPSTASQNAEEPSSFSSPGAGDEIVCVKLPVEPSKPRKGRGRGVALVDPGRVLLAGAGCLIASMFRAFRKQQNQLSDACKHLKSVEERLAAKEQVLEQAEEERKKKASDQEVRADDLGQQVSEAQRELESARDVCRAAASKLEQSMSDLSVTETELRAARTQLQNAGRDLAMTRAQLDATEGELGLTRSANELMKREVDTLRRQLREAGQQLEGYILVSRSRKNRQDAGGMGRDEEDDLAAAAGADWEF